MRLLIILLTALTLSACASNRVPLPDWAEARQDFGEIHNATDLPLLCEIPWITIDCWDALDVYEDIAEDNKELANLNASALRKVIGAYDNAISGGEMQQQISEIYRELLEEERKDHFWDNMAHKAVIGIGLLLGATL